MKTKIVDPKLLTEWHLNPKLHPKEQLEHIGNSIKDLGWLETILVDENYRILCGHGRVKAAIKEKLKEVPVIVVSGLTEAQKAGFTIFDNESVKMTGLDGDKLDDCYAAAAGGCEEALERYGLTIEKLGSTDGKRSEDKDSTGEALETFLNNEIKQITMYFATDEYSKIVDTIEKIIETNPDITNRT